MPSMTEQVQEVENQLVVRSLNLKLMVGHRSPLLKKGNGLGCVSDHQPRGPIGVDVIAANEAIFVGVPIVEDAVRTDVGMSPEPFVNLASPLWEFLIG